MAKFKVGDRVCVKKVCKDVQKINFVDDMKKRLGTYVTISKVFGPIAGVCDSPTYYISEDKVDGDIQYFWAEEWLEQVDRMRIYGPQ